LASLKVLNPSALHESEGTIHRRFFQGAIVVILTAGAVWGALLLLRIGFSKSFTAVSIHDVNAHGHAQIFGWIGLFVMGFAYRAFPRMKNTTLWRPDLASVTFYLMTVGLMARVIGEPSFRWPVMRGAAVAGSVTEIVAIALFITILVRTFRFSSGPLERPDGYLAAGLGFFLIQAVYDLFLLIATIGADDRDALLHLVSTYQAPLRDMQIHGFGMLMVLGVGLYQFPALFGFVTPGPKLVRRCLFMVVLGIVAEAGFFIVMRLTGNHAWSGPMYGGMCLVASGSVALTFRWGLLARPMKPDRSTKFIRMAVAWLHTSMVLLVLVPLYARSILPGAETLSPSGAEAREMGFSHAYYGAIRHAITVGFLSLTLMGMAGKVVPTLNDIDTKTLSPLWVPFALVNVGCLIRVVFQITTDFHEWAYPIAGASGLLEVSGLAIWGSHVWRLMGNPQATCVIGHCSPERIEGIFN
jgi:hypothetical protein